jgi:rhodanese-related sulfurtransferase
MKSIAVAAVVALVGLAVAGGCKRDSTAASARPAPAAAPVPIATATVDQVAADLAAARCTPVDANNESTREHMGVVPGAIQLTSYDTYALSELPADKTRPLIFYCANTQCGASHAAAERALIAGYQHVEVMTAGIAGWVTAGQKVDKI